MISVAATAAINRGNHPAPGVRPKLQGGAPGAQRETPPQAGDRASWLFRPPRPTRDLSSSQLSHTWVRADSDGTFDYKLADVSHLFCTAVDVCLLELSKCIICFIYFLPVQCASKYFCIIKANLRCHQILLLCLGGKKSTDAQHFIQCLFQVWIVLMAPVTRGYWERNSILYRLVQKVTYVTVKGFGMNWTEQELDLAHGFVYVYIFI